MGPTDTPNLSDPLTSSYYPTPLSGPAGPRRHPNAPGSSKTPAHRKVASGHTVPFATPSLLSGARPATSASRSRSSSRSVSSPSRSHFRASPAGARSLLRSTRGCSTVGRDTRRYAVNVRAREDAGSIVVTTEQHPEISIVDRWQDPRRARPFARSFRRGSSGRARTGNHARRIPRIRPLVLGVSPTHAARSGCSDDSRAELTNANAPIGGAIAPGSPVAVIDIPRIGVHEVVVEGARSGQLRAGPGHVVGSSLPGQPGNAVIVGPPHALRRPVRALGCAPNRATRSSVTTGQGESTYRVDRTLRSRDRRATESVFGDHGDNRLTLFTVDSAVDASGASS